MTNEEYKLLNEKAKELYKKLGCKTVLESLTKEKFESFDEQFHFDSSDEEDKKDFEIFDKIVKKPDNNYWPDDELFKAIHEARMKGEQYDFGITIEKGAIVFGKNFLKIGNITFQEKEK